MNNFYELSKQGLEICFQSIFVLSKMSKLGRYTSANFLPFLSIVSIYETAGTQCLKLCFPKDK